MTMEINFYEKVLTNNDNIKYMIVKETDIFKKIHKFNENDTNIYFVVICYEDWSSSEVYIDYDLNFINEGLYNKLVIALNDNGFNNLKNKCDNETLNSIYFDTIEELYNLVVEKNTMKYTSIDTFQMNITNIKNYDDTENSSIIDENYNINDTFKKYHNNDYQYKTYSNFLSSKKIYV